MYYGQLENSQLSTLHDANKLCCVHDSIVHGIYLMFYNEKHLNLLKRVRSTGKPGFRFQNQDQVGIFNRTQNPKTDFIAKKSVLIFFLSIFVL